MTCLPRFPLLGSILSTLLLAAPPSQGTEEISLAAVADFALERAARQTEFMVSRLADHPGLPRTFEHGKLVTVDWRDWTSGFFPGTLWYLYEATGDPVWRTRAEQFTANVAPAQHNRSTHDVGFVLTCSFGNGLRLTDEPDYRSVLLNGAASLATRFNPTVGAIRSWDWARQWKYPVIIDNLMNLELLLWAARAGAEPQFRAIALRHADTTLRNHFRPDASCYHVVDYDPETGRVRSKVTHQGSAHNSAWARGQAWAIYGYTMLYRETGESRYLQQARATADFVMRHPRLPADKIPYWDFDAADIPHAPRDASAAAVIASALLELSTLLPGDDARAYAGFAEAQLRSLASPAYLAAVGENGGFILKHSTGNLPRHGEIDVPLTYADYYFLEALLRLRRLNPKA